MLAERLEIGLHQLGLELSAEQQEKLLAYQALIQKWNKVYNLTAVREPYEMLTHHLLDCLAIIKPLQKHFLRAGVDSPRLLDVGAGAGLPGVVIAICCPQVRVSCVDAVGKKVSFINQVVATLALRNLQGVHARVEALPAKIVLQGFDVVTSRAFSALEALVALTAPHLKPGVGVWAAMKAKDASAETSDLPSGVQVFHVEQLAVPFLDEERRLVWLSKWL